MKNILLFLCSIIIASSCNTKLTQEKMVINNDMMVRIAEIEIYPEYLNEYISILKEESEASVRIEQGVISIYPMFEKESPTQIRILEIYASKKDYESHLQTPHFKHYKTATLHMVKGLKLTEMTAINPESMPKIFKKLKSGKTMP